MMNDLDSRKPDWLARAKRYFAIAAACAGAVVVSDWLRARDMLVPDSVFLPLHTTLEFASIVVSFAVFVTGWFGYKQTGNKRDLFLGVVFLMTGAMDFVHTFTYQEMPAFLGASGVAKATTFWTLARVIASVGLLWACLIDPASRKKVLHPTVLLAAGTLIFAASIGLVVHYYPISVHLFYDIDRGGLTKLKIGTEYLVIALYALTFVLCTSRRGWDQSTIVPLRSALIIGMFAELCFTLYVSPFAPTNMLGHFLKTASYYLILGALFVSSIRRPYQELAGAKEELQELYRDAQEHRHEIEQSFARIGSALSSSIRPEEALNQIADLVVNMPHADYSVVTTLPKVGGAAQVSAERGETHVRGRALEVALQVGNLGIDREKSSIIENNLADSGWISCDYTFHNCLRSMVCAPMFYRDESDENGKREALGVIAIYSHEFGAFDEGDAAQLEAFASHAAVAIHNAMSYEREERVADVLQKSFLSPDKIVVDGFEIASKYASALEEAKVGGDFYDVTKLSDGRIALVIGDVSGKGLAAAVHTAMAKYALRAYLSEGHGPAAALTRLDKTVAESTKLETFVTLFCGILDTKTGELAYASAGHEPAIYCANGSNTLLNATGPILGLGLDSNYEQETVTLENGSILLLYTDGVSEARRDKVLMGIDRIGEELLTCRDTCPEKIVECVYKAACNFTVTPEYPEGNLRDDVAILAVRALD